MGETGKNFDMCRRMMEMLDALTVNDLDRGEEGFKNTLSGIEGVDPRTGQITSLLDIFKSDISEVIAEISAVSPELAGLQTGDLSTRQTPIGSATASPVEGTKGVEQAAADLANSFAETLKEQKIIALSNKSAQEAAVKAAELFDKSAESLENFAKIAQALNETLSEKITTVIEQSVKIDLDLPEGSVTRLSTVEGAVDSVREQLKNVVDQLTSGNE